MLKFGSVTSRLAGLLLVLCFGACTPDRSQRPNILFIAIDDLRPEIGAYGIEHMYTPNLDRLSSEGFMFTQHYVQAPTCGASRYALLTGRRPTRSEPQSYGNGAFGLLTEERAERTVSMPHHFRQNGYYTVSIGKVTHSPDGRLHEKTTQPGAVDDPSAPPELPSAWDEVYTPRGEWETAWRAFFAYADGNSRIPGETPATERAAVSDTGYPDGLIAREATAQLQKLAERDQPFFLAVGFYKPHLPFTAPQKYWDLYSGDVVGTAPRTSPPEGVDPAISLHRSSELGRYAGAGLADSDTVGPSSARTLRHAYSAAVSYADAQLGKVLDELDRLGLRDETIVVVWGDHGWHLGDLGIWGKHTLHEAALRSPLIVRLPGAESSGRRVEAVVETVDIYPTLVELSGLDQPEGLDGEGLASLLTDETEVGQGAAYGYWRNNGFWGKTIRTDRHRLTRWRDADDRIVQVELYDHATDPNETANIAPSAPSLVDSLSRRLESDDDSTGPTSAGPTAAAR